MLVRTNSRQKKYIMEKSILNFEKFLEKYKPKEEKEGSIKQYDWTNEEDLKELKVTSKSKIWTCLDSEGKLYLVNGVWIVNRMFYVVCEEECNEERGTYEFVY